MPVLQFSVGTFANAAELPTDFLGVWMAEGSSKTNCTRQDFKDPESDATVVLIEPKLITGLEHQCGLLSAEPDKDVPGAIVAHYRCSGEGLDWNEAQTLSLHRILGRRLLVQAVRITNRTFENEKNEPAPKVKGFITIYQECERASHQPFR
jgi:hypothetical protein